MSTAIMEFTGEYRWLSNFWLVPIEYKGKYFPSVEHAYCSAKSEDPIWKEYCQNPHFSAGAIKKASRKVPLVENWNEIKESVMEECLRNKFSHPHLKELLLATGDAVLIEGNWWNDQFWGVNLRTNQGQNKLGELLMCIREDLRNNLNQEKRMGSNESTSTDA